MAETTIQTTMLAAGLGFALAVAVIVAALFQDSIVAALRWLAAGGRRVVAPRVAALARTTSARVRTALMAAMAATRSALGRAVLWGTATRLRRKTASLPPRIVSTTSNDDEIDIQPVLASEQSKPRQDSAIGGYRQYTPASAIHIEEAARAFLAQRAGQSSLDAIARHFDRRFGAGMGVPLLDSLVTRGLLRVTRSRSSPTQMVAILNEPTPEPTTDG